MVNRFSLILFYVFSGLKDKSTKTTFGVFFSSLFKLSKNEKDRVIFVVKLVKTSNSDKLVNRDKTEFHLR